MPTSAPKKPKQPEVGLGFYWEKPGKRADSAIHEPILADGDSESAKKIARQVAIKAGLTSDDCDALGL